MICGVCIEGKNCTATGAKKGDIKIGRLEIWHAKKTKNIETFTVAQQIDYSKKIDYKIKTTKRYQNSNSDFKLRGQLDNVR